MTAPECRNPESCDPESRWCHELERRVFLTRITIVLVVVVPTALERAISGIRSWRICGHLSDDCSLNPRRVLYYPSHQARQLLGATIIY